MWNCSLAFFMLIPLSKAAMAPHSCSSDKLPFFFLFKNLFPPDCLPTHCDTSTGELEVSLGLPLNLCRGGSVAIISTAREATHPTPLALNLPDLLWGGEALGMQWLLKRRTPAALPLRLVHPPRAWLYEPPPLTVPPMEAPRLSNGTCSYAPPTAAMYLPGVARHGRGGCNPPLWGDPNHRQSWSCHYHHPKIPNFQRPSPGWTTVSACVNSDFYINHSPL
jgi:hypothetical protein